MQCIIVLQVVAIPVPYFTEKLSSRKISTSFAFYVNQWRTSFYGAPSFEYPGLVKVKDVIQVDCTCMTSRLIVCVSGALKCACYVHVYNVCLLMFDRCNFQVAAHFGIETDPDSRDQPEQLPVARRKLEEHNEAVKKFVARHFPGLEPTPSIVEKCMYTVAR